MKTTADYFGIRYGGFARRFNL